MATVHFTTTQCKLYTAHKVQESNIGQARFEDVRTFPSVFMSVGKVYVHCDLKVNITVAIFFSSYVGPEAMVLSLVIIT